MTLQHLCLPFTLLRVCRLDTTRLHDAFVVTSSRYVVLHTLLRLLPFTFYTLFFPHTDFTQDCIYLTLTPTLPFTLHHTLRLCDLDGSSPTFPTHSLHTLPTVVTYIYRLLRTFPVWFIYYGRLYVTGWFGCRLWLVVWDGYYSLILHLPTVTVAICHFTRLLFGWTFVTFPFPVEFVPSCDSRFVVAPFIRYPSCVTAFAFTFTRLLNARLTLLITTRNLLTALPHATFFLL